MLACKAITDSAPLWSQSYCILQIKANIKLNNFPTNLLLLFLTFNTCMYMHLCIFLISYPRLIFAFLCVCVYMWYAGLYAF